MGNVIEGYGHYKLDQPSEMLQGHSEKVKYKSLLSLSVKRVTSEFLVIGIEKRMFDVYLAAVPDNDLLGQVVLNTRAARNEYDQATESIEHVGSRIVELLLQKYVDAFVEKESPGIEKHVRLEDDLGNSITVMYDSETVFVHYDSASLNQVLNQMREKKREQELKTLEKL